MINNIAFTGRETMLTKGIEKGIEKGTATINKYTGAGKIYTTKEIAEAEQQVQNALAKDAEKRLAHPATNPEDLYTSPFNPTGMGSAAKAENYGESYALAHGTPKNAIHKVDVLA